MLRRMLRMPEAVVFRLAQSPGRVAACDLEPTRMHYFQTVGWWKPH